MQRSPIEQSGENFRIISLCGKKRQFCAEFVMHSRKITQRHEMVLVREYSTHLDQLQVSESSQLKFTFAAPEVLTDTSCN